MKFGHDSFIKGKGSVFLCQKLRSKTFEPNKDKKEKS